MRLSRRRTVIAVLVASCVALAAFAEPASSASATPTVTGVAPARGDTGGGTTVTVSGSGFDASARVLFGSTAGLSVQVASASSLTMTAPAHVAGTVDLRVQTTNGTSALVTGDRFVYSAPLPVTGLRARVDGQSQQTLSWSNPASADFGVAVVRRVIGTTAPASPTAGDGVPTSTATSAVITGLTGGVTYSYAVFARDRNGDYAAPAVVTATTAGCTPQPVYFSGALTTDTTLSPQCVSRYVLTGPVTVAVGATVTVQPGVTIAADPSAGVAVDGTLRAQGTDGGPVTFTSTAASPQAGAWPGISVRAGGAATLAGTTVQYAATALRTATGTHVRIRGRILASTVGVQAPDALGDPGGVVDARGVWWGDASGPAPLGDGPAVQGSGVVVTPWTGFALPPRPAPAAVNSTPPASVTCGTALFLGARGSDESPQGAAVGDPAVSDRQLLGARVAPVLDAMTAAVGSAARIRVVGLRYAAVGPPYAAFSDFDAGFYAAVWTGVDQLETTLAREHARCPGERIVLAGYSQGALVVHLALTELDRQGRLAGYPIAAVELLADPARTSTDADTRYGAAPSTSGGVWTIATGATPLPAAVVARTAEYCHADDAVCAALVPDPTQPDGTLDYDAYGAPHASYPQGNELDVLGRHAAARVRS